MLARLRSTPTWSHVGTRALGTFFVAGAIALFGTGCAKKPAKDVSETTSARMPRSNVNLGADLARLCKIKFSDVARAPKFDFDDATLLPEDRDILEQVAKCVTEGPLKGRKLALVGRADPRGEVEYNMVLGDHRADSVRDYLARLGVEADGMSQTSRGELDAEGHDDETYRRDRRVDIMLQ